MEHAERNEQVWDAQADSYQERHGQQLDKSGGAAWGLWQMSEDEMHALGDVAGKDVLELGCGAAQWSIELREARRTTGRASTSRSGSWSTRGS